MIKDLGEQDMTKQGLKLTAICLATFGCIIVLDYLIQAFSNSIPSDKRVIVNAVLAFLAFISLMFESYFFPLRKIYRILKKKRELIKKAENK